VKAEEGLVGGSKYQIAAQRANLATVLSDIERGDVVACFWIDEGKTVVVDVTWTSRVGFGSTIMN
jgi:hypothetical protein